MGLKLTLAIVFTETASPLLPLSSSNLAPSRILLGVSLHFSNSSLHFFCFFFTRRTR